MRWTSEPAAPTDLRDEFTVKIRADAALNEVDLSDELRARIAQHTERLAHYRAIEARDFARGDAMPRAKRLQHLILKKGIMYEEGKYCLGEGGVGGVGGRVGQPLTARNWAIGAVEFAQNGVTLRLDRLIFFQLVRT